jgi:hypothetical protein
MMFPVFRNKKRSLDGRGMLMRALAAILAVLIWAHARGASPLEERFRTEAPQAWKQYREFWLTLEGTNSGERRGKTDGKWSVLPLRMFWKQCKCNSLTEIESLDPESYSGKIQVENSEYGFVLVRSKDTKPWVINDVYRRRPAADTVDGSKALAIGLILGDRTPCLPEVCEMEGFEVIDIAPEASGDSLVRLTFTVTPKDPIRLLGGRLVLDPTRDWIIRSGEVEWDLGEKTEGRKKCVIQTEYKEGPDHHPIVTRGTMKCAVWQQGRITAEIETLSNLDLHQRAFIPDSEFTLSAFGFPEPFLAPPKQTPWYLWLALAGMLCLLLGAVVAWRKRRQAA